MKLSRLFFCLPILFLAACAVNHDIYYWGKYSETAYQYKKDPTPENRKAHFNSMLDIVEHAKAKHKKIPPGIYAELGMMEEKDHDNAKALEYFHMEESLFPESAPLLNRMIGQIKKGS
ncbi:DUF4810 domain-containing protein [Gallaecimonas mangrovi]|uniref:DUF4810 domain-containing protein n=1 Tax=Gallaecimonas mangrovi TaxID=2291597 RepID=UPI000E20876E|nr:DUF4810 domain-containing protein [Gallaecimonas mangrovi]